MKKLFALFTVLFFVFVSASFADENLGFPTKDGIGSIGKYQRAWGNLWIKNQNLGYATFIHCSGANLAQSLRYNSPAVQRVTKGYLGSTHTMSYIDPIATNTGKMFYIINCSSNTVTFKQSGATGVNVATLKIVTVVGNGTDFVRITADQ